MQQPKIEIQRFECLPGNLTKQGAISHVKEMYEEGFVMTASEWRKEEDYAPTE